MYRKRWLELALSILAFFSLAIAQQKGTPLEENIAVLEKKVAALEKQIGLLEKKIAGLEKKLAELEKKLPPAVVVKPAPALKVTPTEKPSFYIGNACTKKF